MLVVRVKRNRNDDPAENICVYEDNQPSKKRSITKHLTALSTTPDVSSYSVNRLSGSHVVLTRIQTLDYQAGVSLDNQTMSIIGTGKRGRSEIEDVPSSKTTDVTQTRKIMVTKGKKTLKTDANGKFVVLDMTQIGSEAKPIAASTTSTSGTETTVRSPMKILNPATRLLERGIKTAVEKGDFNDLASALLQGADANHQSTVDGMTPLMAATSRCNIRMVKRLLLKDIDVLLKDTKNGLTALDMLKETPRNKEDCLQIRLLLQAATTKAYAATSRQSERNSAAVSMLLGDSENSPYVVDIYCVQGQGAGDVSMSVVEAEDSSSSSSSAAPQTLPSTAVNKSPASAMDTSQYSIVRVEGLRINSAEGDVELVDTEYDSDWSDLGDDEEPDSNDERFEGNDYPDEEDEDDEGGAGHGGAAGGSDDDSDDEQRPRRQAGFGGRGGSGGGGLHSSGLPSSDDVLGPGNVRFSRNISAYKAAAALPPGRTMKTAFERFQEEDRLAFEKEEEEGEDQADSYDEEEEDNARYTASHRGGSNNHGDGSDYDFSADEAEAEEDARIPRFDRNYGIGKVLRPHVVSMSGDSAAVVNSHGAHDSESLRELWGETDVPMGEDEEGQGGSGGGESRLQHMRARTGMQFGANPREFGMDGLPKYGVELSDDDEQMLSQFIEDRTRQALGGSGLERDMVAYDSELDRSDDE